MKTFRQWIASIVSNEIKENNNLIVDKLNKLKFEYEVDRFIQKGDKVLKTDPDKTLNHHITEYFNNYLDINLKNPSITEMFNYTYHLLRRYTLYIETGNLDFVIITQLKMELDAILYKFGELYMYDGKTGLNKMSVRLDGKLLSECDDLPSFNISTLNEYTFFVKIPHLNLEENIKLDRTKLKYAINALLLEDLFPIKI